MVKLTTNKAMITDYYMLRNWPKLLKLINGQYTVVLFMETKRLPPSHPASKDGTTTGSCFGFNLSALIMQCDEYKY